jgi:hypothetical protein
MRFSIVLVLFAIVAPILAAKAAKPKVAAHPGDLVVVEAQHFHGGDIGKTGTSDKPHPAIVVHHDPNTHNVHVVPIAHGHPVGVPTMPAHELGISAAPGSLVSLAPPRVIHQDNINKALGPPPKGRVGLPEKLDEVQFNRLNDEIGECIHGQHVDSRMANEHD